MSFDPELFGQAMGEAIRRAVEPLQAEIAALKKQLAEMPIPENGKDGAPGRDGKDCDMEQVKAWIDDAVKAIPAPENGKDGRDGKDGKDGSSVTLQDVRPMLEEALADVRREAQEAIDSAVKSIPVPKDGKDGKDGADGKDGESFTIEDAEKLLDSKMARWELDFERRANDTLQRAIDRLPVPKDGKDGEPGKDGADGVGFDDLECEYDGERTISLVFAKGDRVKRFDVTLPVVIDRGVYKQGTDYEAGDGVTWGGSYWIAQKSAPTGKPGEPGSEGWRLAVKRGRDGRDGKDGVDRTKPVEIGK